MKLHFFLIFTFDDDVDFYCIVHHWQGGGAASVKSDTAFPVGSTAGHD